MLDLKHPQTEHVFAAARIEDDIRIHLLAMQRDGKTRERIEQVVEVLIPKLATLNLLHFGNSAGISRTLQQLERAVCEEHPEDAWRSFLRLAEQPGDNFGTWAI